jgi:hypothetical protein
MSKADLELIRFLVEQREVCQKQRIAFSNRIGAIERGADNAGKTIVSWMEEQNRKYEDEEGSVTGLLEEICKGVEIVERVSSLYGVGTITAARLIAEIDIAEADTISSLWKYAGYYDHTGNRRLKTVCYLIGTSLLRTKSPYRKDYDTAVEFYANTKQEWTKGHRHMAALRKVIKLFLSHLWVQWRAIEGLPVTEPYALDKLGHKHLKTSQEYGWPAL